MKGTKLPDGQLVAGGPSSVYVWKTMPTMATQNAALTVRNNFYKNGDGPEVVMAGGKIYINNYNGNNVHVYNAVPTQPNQMPDFALGSPTTTVNTLDSINYIQNPVIATDVLGQPVLNYTQAAIGVNRLFMPPAVAAQGNVLWVGEGKFSSRLLRFSADNVVHVEREQAVTVGYELL